MPAKYRFQIKKGTSRPPTPLTGNVQPHPLAVFKKFNFALLLRPY